MRHKRLVKHILIGSFLAFSYCVCFLIWFSRQMSEQELALRQEIVTAAETYLGYNEADGSHQVIIDIYNTQESLPRDYVVNYGDSWCAVFGCAVAMQTKMADWIPMECSCQQQIALFDQQGEWQESDWYLPRPGDYIFYDWDARPIGRNTGWSDHVGIVVDTCGPIIKVIEGNKDDCVTYRYVFINHPYIRGYGLPDYRKAAACS